jgi:SHS2 domain-containing protein
MIAYGSTLAELFENVAYGIAAHSGFDDRRSPLYDVAVMAIGDSPEELLGDWLVQLDLRSIEAGLSLVSFSVDRLEEGGVQGTAAGYRSSETVLPQRWDVETIVLMVDAAWARIRKGSPQQVS